MLPPQQLDLDHAAQTASFLVFQWSQVIRQLYNLGNSMNESRCQTRCRTVPSRIGRLYRSPSQWPRNTLYYWNHHLTFGYCRFFLLYAPAWLTLLYRADLFASMYFWASVRSSNSYSEVVLIRPIPLDDEITMRVSHLPDSQCVLPTIAPW